MSQFNGGRILIIGNGVSGNGAAYAMKKTGVQFDQADEQEAVRLAQENKYSTAIVSPGIKICGALEKVLSGNNIDVIGEIEAGYLLNSAKIVAVTGTNGKTTVCKMLSLMLSKRYRTVLCGNIGVSFSAKAADGGYDVAVVEVSSFQLETVRLFHPDVAIITNISEDHLDRHETMDKYASIKKRIAQNQTKRDYLVLSQDGISIKYLTDFAPESKVVFGCVRGKIDGAFMENGKFYYFDEFIADKTHLPFGEKYNYENFLLAATAARAMGVTCDEIRRAIAEFRQEKHRLQLVRLLQGVRFYDDSKGTNVAATVAALNEMKGSVCLIAGGSDKKASYAKIFNTNADLCKVNLIGSTKYNMRETAYYNGFSNVEIFDDLASAVHNAYKSGCENVLFSPACASFDMFENYAQRGDCFAEIVNALV